MTHVRFGAAGSTGRRNTGVKSLWWVSNCKVSRGRSFICQFRKSALLFDHLVGKRKHRWGNLNTQHLGGPQIKTEVKLRLLDRNIADPFSPQNLVNKMGAAVPKCGEIYAVRQQ